MRFLCPTGIGDVAWALHKIQAVAERHNANCIDVGLTCGIESKVETRALDFVRRFEFINSVCMCPGYGILQEPFFTKDGYWNYIEDGFYEIKGERWCVLTPNVALERGFPLGSGWLPHIPIRWDIWNDFRITNAEAEQGVDMTPHGDYAVFYPGPLDGNTVQGHNRNMIWRPQDWIELGKRLHDEHGLSIVAVGAMYDAPYYDTLLGPNLNGASGYWTNLIGQTNLGSLFTITKHARMVISYQAGVGIVSTYLGTPTGIFWRAKGDSILREGYLSFEEEMASSWVPPAMCVADGTHLPLIYGRHGVDHIMQEMERRKW